MYFNCKLLNLSVFQKDVCEKYNGDQFLGNNVN